MTDVKLQRVRDAILREIEADPRLTINSLARKAGIRSASTLYDFLKYGRTRSFTYDTLEKVASALGKSVAELEKEGANSPRGLQVIGIIGAGAVIVKFDDHPQGGGMYEIAPPPGVDPDEYIALEVRGDSQRPMLEHGWLVIYRKNQEGVPEDCIGKLCVVQLADGAMMVKRLRRGYEPGRFNLESVNAAPIENAHIEWAAKVRWIEQR